MKSRKNLKKQIKKSFNILYLDVLFYEAFVVGANKDAARDLLDKMIASEDELISQVSVYGGKRTEGGNKKHFSKLNESLRNQINSFAKEVTALA